MKYSVSSCLLFGFNNFIIGDLASKHGQAGLWPLSFGYLLCWMTYHASTKSTGFYKKNTPAVVGLFIRAANHLFLMVVTFLAF